MVNNKMSAQRWRSIKLTLLRHREIQKNIKKEDEKYARRETLLKNFKASLWDKYNILVYSNLGYYVKRFILRFLINPIENRKLSIFRLIVACTFYVDFFTTGFILSNYELLQS